MFTFSEMLALVESESSFDAYVCHRRPGGSIAISDLVLPRKVRSGCVMLWECLKTFVPCAIARADYTGHGASLGKPSQSQCESSDRSGVGHARLDDEFVTNCMIFFHAAFTSRFV